MTLHEASEGQPLWQRLLRRLTTIQGKIILPFAILTWAVAAVGFYVVFGLVASSVDERLKNQLIEAGKVVSDSLAFQELDHIESARAVAFTVGLAEALEGGERERVAALALPAAAVRGVECLIVTDAQGQAVLHVLRQADGRFVIVAESLDPSGLWMVQAQVQARDPNALPERGVALHFYDNRYYYFTAIPVPLGDELVGVVVVGTSIDELVVRFNKTALAEVVIHVDGGRAAGAAFRLPGQPASEGVPLDELSITPQVYESALHSTKTTLIEDIRVRDYPFRVGHSSLRVADDIMGVFTVALPSSFVVEKQSTARGTYTALFAAGTLAVFVIGYVISRRITSPISRLVRTSRAVAEGDLEQRTGIVGTDEIGLLAATFDVMTERLADRTRALEETLGRLRAILSSIGDGVLLEDLEQNLIPLNAAAESMLQDMADSFLLSPLRELSTQSLEDIAEMQPNPWLLERRRFEVGRKMFSAQTAAVRTDDGELLGTVIVLRDVTVEVEAERLKDAFVAHVSHELRTPLTAIKGYSELLLAHAGGALDEDQRGFLETIHRHTEDLVAMISALLDFSEMEAGGGLRLQRRPTPLSGLIEEAAKKWRPQMEEKGLVFQVEIADNLPLVNLDARRLRYAIANLVRNAWQYTPEGGGVTLRLSECDGQLALDVTDTGAGIPPEDRKYLFSRFYRAPDASQDSGRGIGLGLFVARAIVEAHGGQIHVLSEEGMGSTFRMTLPPLET